MESGPQFLSGPVLLGGRAEVLVEALVSRPSLLVGSSQVRVQAGGLSLPAGSSGGPHYITVNSFCIILNHISLITKINT